MLDLDRVNVEEVCMYINLLSFSSEKSIVNQSEAPRQRITLNDRLCVLAWANRSTCYSPELASLWLG